MFHFIKNTVQVIRYKNLLFLSFIQFAMQQFVVSPIMQKYGFEYINPNSTLYLLVAATLFIAAAGYVINDYFDIKIDRINKPDKQIVGPQFLHLKEGLR